MWLVKGKPVDASDVDNVHFTSTLLPGDIVEASVTLKVNFHTNIEHYFVLIKKISNETYGPTYNLSLFLF